MVVCLGFCCYFVLIVYLVGLGAGLLVCLVLLSFNLWFITRCFCCLGLVVTWVCRFVGFEVCCFVCMLVVICGFCWCICWLGLLWFVVYSFNGLLCITLCWVGVLIDVWWVLDCVDLIGLGGCGVFVGCFGF